MSKSNPSEIKLAAPSAPQPVSFRVLNKINFQVFVMIAAIVVIMLFSR